MYLLHQFEVIKSLNQRIRFSTVIYNWKMMRIKVERVSELDRSRSLTLVRDGVHILWKEEIRLNSNRKSHTEIDRGKGKTFNDHGFYFNKMSELTYVLRHIDEVGSCSSLHLISNTKILFLERVKFLTCT